MSAVFLLPLNRATSRLLNVLHKDVLSRCGAIIISVSGHHLASCRVLRLVHYATGVLLLLLLQLVQVYHLLI